jgi:hypothetical protein
MQTQIYGRHIFEHHCILRWRHKSGRKVPTFQKTALPPNYTMKMEAEGSFEMFVPSARQRCHIPEGSEAHNHFCNNLNSHKLFSLNYKRLIRIRFFTFGVCMSVHSLHLIYVKTLITLSHGRKLSAYKTAERFFLNRLLWTWNPISSNYNFISYKLLQYQPRREEHCLPIRTALAVLKQTIYLQIRQFNWTAENSGLWMYNLKWDICEEELHIFKPRMVLRMKFAWYRHSNLKKPNLLKMTYIITNLHTPMISNPFYPMSEDIRHCNCTLQIHCKNPSDMNMCWVTYAVLISSTRRHIWATFYIYFSVSNTKTRFS